MSHSDDGSGTQDVVKIKRSPPQKWRFVCPNGHSNWSLIDGCFHCQQCSRNSDQGADVDPQFFELYDKENEEFLPRERVEIILEDETIKW